MNKGDEMKRLRVYLDTSVINKQIQINALNEKLGYLRRLNLLTPLGVMSNEDKGE